MSIINVGVLFESADCVRASEGCETRALGVILRFYLGQHLYCDAALFPPSADLNKYMYTQSISRHVVYIHWNHKEMEVGPFVCTASSFSRVKWSHFAMTVQHFPTSFSSLFATSIVLFPLFLFGSQMTLYIRSRLKRNSIHARFTIRLFFEFFFNVQLPELCLSFGVNGTL